MQENTPELDRFVIELENIAPGARTVMTDPVSQTTLHFAVGTARNPSRLPLTAEQFRLFSYDIEHRVHGLRGTEKDFVLWAVNLRTQERQQISFKQAQEILGVIDSAAAEQLQQAKRKAAEAERKKKREQGGMQGAAQAVMAAAPGAAPVPDIDLGG